MSTRLHIVFHWIYLRPKQIRNFFQTTVRKTRLLFLSVCEKFTVKTLENPKEIYSACKTGYRSAGSRQQLLREIDETLQRLEEIEQRFNTATEEELITAAAYQRLAAQAQYRYLLRLSHQENLQREPLQQLQQ